MNRINLSPLASASTQQSNTHDDSQTQTTPTASVFAFDKFAPQTESEVSVFAPLNYVESYAYPLIIWLHSDGRSSSELESLMANVSVQNYVGIAPQASVGNFQCGYFWEQDFDSIEAAQVSIDESIRQATNRFNINPKRIFLAGSGGGGTMAIRIGLRQPDKFAGIISLNGQLPEGHSPLAQWSGCREMPIFWSYFLDTERHNEKMCDQFRFLCTAGFLNLSAREYPTQSLQETMAPNAINCWIMEQIESAIL
ncbi:MAG: hypothetical protein AAFN77_06720 [Planctomycetota bacterium]